MSKILHKKVTVEVELDQDEIDSLYNLLDMFYNEPNYKRWAHRLSQLRKNISPYANTDTIKKRVMSRDTEPPF